MESLKLFTESLILDYGYTGIFSITALEQFIFPLPVDPLLGLSLQIGLDYQKLMIFVLIATLFGSSIGYLLGKYLGHPALEWLVGKKKVEKGEKFIKKWGIWGVIIAGITPIPFKVITWTAGAFEMPFGRFMIGTIIGRMPRYMLTAYLGGKLLESKFYATESMSAIILGSLQGVTEFLPISSSGHLVVMEHFLKVPMAARELITFDIFLHGGSLIAILIYFWKDWLQVLKEIWQMIRKFHLKTNTLAFKLAAGTIPAIIAGLAFGDFISNKLRTLHSVAFFFILIGIAYFLAAWKGKKNAEESVSLKKGIIIGCAQALALIPGISRAGSTIATGVSLGINRETAARFSFMLGGIAILAANVYALLTPNGGEATLPDLKFVLFGAGSALATSLLAIHFLLRFLKKHGMHAFGIYLILVGSVILSFL